MNATAMRATSRTTTVCRAASSTPANRASSTVASPLRRSAAGSVSRRNTSSSSSKLNGAAVANASSKTLAVERVRSDEGEEAEELEYFEEFEDEDDGTGLTGSQVQSLLAVLCEETQLAELEVRLGSFELHVVRSRDSLSSAPSSSSGASAAVQVAPGAPTFPTPAPGTAFASTASMDGAALGSAASAATASFDATMSLDDDDAGVSTLLLGSPKVGLLRRGRYVKGKRVGKGNAVEEGAEVKKGQVLGYVEQLGTFMPIEAPQAGELVAFLVEEGKPVEYRQPVAEIAPFFGGHIIGDSKHA